MSSTQILLANYATAHAVADAAPPAHYLRRGGRQRLLDGLGPHLLRSQTSRRQRGEGVVAPPHDLAGALPVRSAAVGRQPGGSARSSNSGCVTSSDSPFSMSRGTLALAIDERSAQIDPLGRPSTRRAAPSDRDGTRRRRTSAPWR